ncbi:MAG: ABC transporter substrate-binding protein [Alphaproteobacteria bacterium]|nr:ABC transporter substrate-binding protein [Alphaproteobacteria bacterium]
MVVAAVSTPRGFDPDIFLPGTHEATVNIYENLLRHAIRTLPDGRREMDFTRHEGHFAEGWTVSEDGKTFTFRIRPGVRSPFGNELTSADIIWTFQKSAHQRRTGAFMRSVSRIAAIDIIDPRTVRFTLSDPNRLFLDAMTLNIPTLYDSTEVKKHATAEDPFGARWLERNTAGFGAYHLQSLTPGQGAVFVANPNYVFEAPFYTRIVYRETPSPASRVALLRSGQVQHAESIPVQQVVDLQRDANVRVERAAGLGGAELRMNPKFPPFDNPRVRQALQHSVDFNAIAQSVFFGLGQRMQSLIAPSAEGYMPAFGASYDPERARALLREAGHPNGIDITLEYSSNYWWEEALALQVQASAARAGIRITPKRIPPTEMNARRAINQRTLPFFTYLPAPFVPDPSYSLYMAGHTRGGQNFNGYESAAFDRAVDASIVARDPAARIQALQEAQRIAAADAMFLPTFLPGVNEAFAACIRGFVWSPTNRVIWRNLRCER